MNNNALYYPKNLNNALYQLDFGNLIDTLDFLNKIKENRPRFFSLASPTEVIETLVL